VKRLKDETGFPEISPRVWVKAERMIGRLGGMLHP